MHREKSVAQAINIDFLGGDEFEIEWERDD